MESDTTGHCHHDCHAAGAVHSFAVPSCDAVSSAPAFGWHAIATRAALCAFDEPAPSSVYKAITVLLGRNARNFTYEAADERLIVHAMCAGLLQAGSEHGSVRGVPS